MKFCPVCQTQYDEEIMRFCTKDGTPLVEEEAPNFTEMPSENLDSNEDDDFGAATVIRRKPSETEITNVEPRSVEKPQRMTIPTSEQIPAQQQQQVRAKQSSYQPPPPPKKTSTAAVVLLTFLGTVIVLGGGLGIYWLMSGSGGGATVSNSNSNLNAVQDTNLNTNLNIDNSLFNVNSDTNANTKVNADANTNVNANLKSPSPTPSRSPSPSPSRTPTPTPSPDDDDGNSNSGNSNSGGEPVNARPSPNASPRTTPPVNVGNLNSRAVSLSKPAYPPAARQMRASGQVPVQVTLDETGRVIAAKATSGHPLLRQAAENAARNSRFDPVRVSGQAVKSVGTVVYNFVGN